MIAHQDEPRLNGYSVCLASYPPQVEQLELVQLPQELPPPMGVAVPPATFEKDAKDETSRLAFFPHLGHLMLSSAWLNDRSKSNRLSQPEQQYS